MSTEEGGVSGFNPTASRTHQFPTGSKHCRRCGKNKFLTEFPVVGGFVHTADGHAAVCKQCDRRKDAQISHRNPDRDHKAYMRAWYHAHKEIKRQECRRCGKRRGWEKFPRDRRSPTGYRNICKACVADLERVRWRRKKAIAQGKDPNAVRRQKEDLCITTSQLPKATASPSSSASRRRNSSSGSVTSGNR